VLTQVGTPPVVDTQLATAIVNLVETILVYKLPALSREEIQTMLDLTDTDLKQTRFYRDVFTEGEEAGRQEGRREEGVSLILRLLQRRCGELAPAIRERITRLSLSQLETLAEALLEFQGIADLEQWLATHGRE
jgi:predicted transposase YdaD